MGSFNILKKELTRLINQKLALEKFLEEYKNEFNKLKIIVIDKYLSGYPEFNTSLIKEEFEEFDIDFYIKNKYQYQNVVDRFIFSITVTNTNFTDVDLIKLKNYNSTISSLSNKDLDELNREIHKFTKILKSTLANRTRVKN